MTQQSNQQQSNEQQSNEQQQYEQLLKIAVEAARLAVDLIYTERPTAFWIEQKSSATDHVTEMDLASEQLIRKIISDHRPGDRIIGEEGQLSLGTLNTESPEVVWFVDPIDGTTNYVYDLPGYAVSIAAQIDGQTVAGLVADPTHDRVYSATLGGGAFCNSALIHLRPSRSDSHQELLATALVATGFSYSAERRARQGKVIAELLPQIRDIRRMGSAALDLCSVASGRVDGYFELGLSPWDWLAGGLIATEAGAELGPLDPTADDSAGLLAAGPELFSPLRELLCSLGADKV